MINVKTRQRLIVRVRGKTGMATPGFEFWVSGFGLPSHDESRLRDFGNGPPCFCVATVAVAEHLFRREPVLLVATFRLAIFDPKQIRGVLNFGLRGRVRFRFHVRSGLRVPLYRTESFFAPQGLRRTVHFLRCTPAAGVFPRHRPGFTPVR